MTVHFHILLALALAVGAQNQGAYGAPLHDPQTGLRLTSYRAPVPDGVPGARVVDQPQVEALRDRGALLIDVMGAPGYRLRDDGTWMVPAPHDTIPGAIWLPEVGHGQPDPRVATFLGDALRLCSGGDLARPIVLFCRSDCWMSWNAVHHVAALGYSDIAWYPGGVDDWSQPLVAAHPLPLSATECRVP